jgi:NAD+ synthase (glutamine-hydrolysing)
MHRAGEKIRAWRENHSPPLSAAEFGEKLGKPSAWPSRTVYGWEKHGKIPRAGIQKRLAELGICDPADWLEPASEAQAKPRGHPFFDMHNHGFVRVATSTPKVRTADVAYNRQGILEEARRAHEQHVDLLLYPERAAPAHRPHPAPGRRALHRAAGRRPRTADVTTTSPPCSERLGGVG